MWFGTAGKARYGKVRSLWRGEFSLGKAGEARLGPLRFGKVC